MFTATLVAIFVTTTFAPGTTAPVGSVTAPDIVPRSDCASSIPANDSTEIAKKAIFFGIFIIPNQPKKFGGDILSGEKAGEKGWLKGWLKRFVKRFTSRLRDRIR